MVISKRIKNNIWLFLLLIYGTSSATPETPVFNSENIDPQLQSEFQAQFKKAQEEFLEAQLKPILKAYEQIDFICEHLAQVINNHQVRNAQEKEAISYIKNLRQTIHYIKNGSYVVVDPGNIKILLAFAEHIIDLVHIIIKNNLQKFPEPALEEIIKRSLQEGTIDFEQLEQQCAGLEKKVKTLDYEAQNIGLKFFNKGYRAVEKFCSNHKVLQRTGLTLLAGLGIYIIISRLDKKSVETMPWLNKISFFKTLKDAIGDAPKLESDEKSGLITLNTENLKAPGNIELYLGKYRLGLMDLTIPPLITWGLLLNPFKNSFKEVGIWANKKWDTMRSYLRGGPLEKRVESWKKEPKVRFKDIIGKEHHKIVLGRVVDYIRDHERYDRAGIAPEAGYLLAGPSRTGKTHIAEALAGEIKDELAKLNLSREFNFLEFNAADIKLFGIGNIMDLAKANAPCVLFIDEIDMCGWQRERDAEGLSQVLTAMSGCMNQDRSKTVIIIGATNKPENLDFALLQKGRFGKVLWFDYPTLEDRIAYVHRELENRSIITISDEYLNKLAQETDRCSFDDLKSIIVTALQKSKAEGKALTENHLEEAFDEEIRHVLHENVPMSELQKRIVSVHQAGHSLASLLLDKTPHITKVTIKPINRTIIEESVYAKYSFDGKSKEESVKKPIPVEYGKLFSSKPQHADTINTYQDLINKCSIELAGHVAEKLILGSSGYTYHKEDKEKALRIAQYLVFEGMSTIKLPKKTQEQLEEKAYALMLECERQVHELLTHHKDKLENLAKALQEKETLSSVEILEVLGLDKEEQEKNMIQGA